MNLQIVYETLYYVDKLLTSST